MTDISEVIEDLPQMHDEQIAELFLAVFDEAYERKLTRSEMEDLLNE